MKIFVASLLLVAVLLVAVFMHFGSKLDVNFKLGDTNGSYSLPFESGYILNKDGRIKILVKFYEKNELFKMDTAERLHIYFSGSETAFRKGKLSSEIKAFYIRLQTRSDYGYLVIKDLQLTQDKKMNYISGLLKSDKVLPVHPIDRSKTFKIERLPLIQVNSVEEMKSQDEKYFIMQIEREFLADWSL
jgi:hypothetical protein